MDANQLIEHFTMDDGHLDLRLFELINDTLDASAALTWSRPDAPSHLEAVRLAERLTRAVAVLRMTLLRDADDAKAAKAEGGYLQDIVAEAAKSLPKHAANDIFAAHDAAAFPTALEAYRTGRIGRGHLTTAVRTLKKLTRFFDDDAFAVLAADLIERAAAVDPVAFRVDCNDLVGQVDDLAKKSMDEIRAARIEQSKADRGMTIVPRDPNHPEYGTDVQMHLAGGDTPLFQAVIDRYAERIRRFRLANGLPAMPLRERRVAAMMEIAKQAATDTERSRAAEAALALGDAAPTPTSEPTTGPSAGEEAPTAADAEVPAAAESSSARTRSRTATRSAPPAATQPIPEPSFDLTSPLFDDLPIPDDYDTAPDWVKEVIDAAEAERAAEAEGTPEPDSTTESDSTIEAAAATESERTASPEQTAEATPSHSTSDDAPDSTARLARGSLRERVLARDRGCVFPGCDVNVERCIVHHIKSFSTGGRTTVRNLCVLCKAHHVTVEHPPGSREYWTIRMADDGIPDAIPPEHIDPHQRPRRHARFRTPYRLPESLARPPGPGPDPPPDLRPAS
ncbi:hypothetical protein BSZ39_03295 [Bowdeniella nasicola]|uniref:HNH nuclease domain-containing protein n=1 Tax=Bowdeniella nasicola TaxID=208480 RepID=A0A1Q5Q435_9ACTO|nr:HNH endonuclease signature motif containing protein [Bowdeniella nasicola]OKL54567.1 hypothetical protein BSZ39_03295 [Bowdeniella nasicola]